MGIQLIEGPVATEGSVGKFDLPITFDRKKYAGEFVLKRDVESKRSRQRLMGAPVTADGWEVWKDPKLNKIHVVSVKEGDYTLMCRPRDVQDAVNIIYGNIGKEAARTEKEGKTVAGENLQDAGMIPVNRMKELGLDREPEETPSNQFAPTPVPGMSQSHLERKVST